MSNQVRKGTIIIGILLVLLMGAPIYTVYAQFGGPIVPCGRDTDGDGVVTSGGADDEQCHFEDLIQIVQNLVNWLLAFAVFFAAILFSWAGFLYLTSGGDTGKVATAHTIFKNVLIGFVIALAAWVIVNAILVGLGVDTAFILLSR